MAEKSLVLRKGREISLRRKHPWVFSGAVYNHNGDLAEGDIVKVLDYKGNFLGIGHFQNSSISVRIISFEDVHIDESFWLDKITKAYNHRDDLGLTASSHTTCYRLVNAEGDGLSGLIIDVYAEAIVVQCHSRGMHNSLSFITKALKKIYGSHIHTIYDKHKLDRSTEQEFLVGLNQKGTVSENGFLFHVNWVEGQKTGFFLDQRDNRQLLGSYSKNKTVLNTFCYTGGFSVYALGGGAKEVISVDISEKAVALTAANMDLNNRSCERQEVIADVMSYLKDHDKKYDIVIVDPPAFAKSQKKRHNAVQAYKRLNALAFKRVESGGLLFTFSCSQVVSRSLFIDTIRAAAIHSRREIQIIHHLSQPSDHPTNIYHPEGAYLKGLVLKVY